MRVALPVVMATLTLTLASPPTPALQARDDVSPLDSIQMTDAQIGWAATTRCGPCPPHVVSGLMLRTTSGGTQWKDVTPVDSSGKRIDVFQFYAFNMHIAWAMRPGTGATTMKIFRTLDGGSTWNGITIPVPGVGLITFINPREGWLLAPLVGYMGRTDEDVYRSTDGGETWIKVASNTKQDSGLTNLSGMTGITFLNSTKGWITGLGFTMPNSFYLYVTHDGGRMWRQQNLPLPPQPQQNQALTGKVTPRWIASLWPPKFFTGQDGVARVDYQYSLFDASTGDTQDTGSEIVFYVTHDSGTSWTYTTPLPVKEINPIRQPSKFVDMNHGWVKDEDILYVTSDGGRRWTSIHHNQLFADVTQLDFISREAGWAVRSPLHGDGKQTFPFLLKTKEGGRTWDPVSYTILHQ